MKIKEVEELTGLTQKSIRLYESKGLLQVERKSGSEYREFTEENVKQLRLIRLLRYLDFSISDIQQLLNADNDTFKAALADQLNRYRTQQEDTQRKEELCRSMMKDVETAERSYIAEEYLTLVKLYHDEDYLQMERDVTERSQLSVGHVLMLTLMFSGPIGWLFLNISNQELDILPLNAIFALISAGLITLLWTLFIIGWVKNRDLQKKRNKGSLWIFPAIVAVLALMLLLAIGIDWLMKVLMCPENWLFFSMERLGTMGLIFLSEIPLIFAALALLGRITKNTDYDNSRNIIALLLRFWKIILPIWAILLYLSFVSVNVVTDNAIIHHSGLHPLGVAYSYEEVQSVETGYLRDGTFYYTVIMQDGTKCLFETPIDNKTRRPDYETDTYLELEEFDTAIMKHQPTKTIKSSKKVYPYDEHYIQRFNRIMNNQTQ